jgi:ATP synthase protein I
VSRDYQEELRNKVDLQARRMRKADRERDTLLAQTIYIGTLGVVFVLPVVVGAYAGQWLDGLAPGYSVRWTLGLLMLGIAVGAVNVYLMVRE